MAFWHPQHASRTTIGQEPRDQLHLDGRWNTVPSSSLVHYCGHGESLLYGCGGSDIFRRTLILAEPGLVCAAPRGGTVIESVAIAKADSDHCAVQEDGQAYGDCRRVGVKCVFLDFLLSLSLFIGFGEEFWALPHLPVDGRVL